MKKFINIRTTLLVAALLAFVACSDDDDFEAGPLATGNGYYFDGTASSSIALSAAETSFTVPVYRSNIGSDATVAVATTVTLTTTDAGGAVVDADASSLFDIPSSVSFGANENVANFTIGYDPDVLEYETYSFTLSVEGSGETSPYGVASYSFTAGVEEPWTSLGKATFYDYFYFYYPYEVEIQQNDLDPTRFRLVEPYLEGLEDPDEGYTDYAPFTPGEYMTFQIMQPGQKLNNTTITMDDLVYFDPYDPGWFFSDYGSEVLIYHPSAFSGWQSESDWTYSTVVSYQADGVTPAMVQLGPIYYMPDYGGYWDCHDDGYIVIVFPGADYVETDYSVGVSYKGTYTDTRDNVYAIGSFTLGADVAYAEVAMAAGNDASSLLYGILDGMVESQTITSDCSLTFPLEDSGQYTIMIVSYDESGEAWEYDYVVISYYASSSENPWTSLGYAEYTDDFVSALYSVGNMTYDVEIQENSQEPGLYRLVNPYGEAYPWNDPGDWDTSHDYYMEVNATDPDYVYIPEFDSGCNWGYGNFLMVSEVGYYVGYGYSVEECKMAGIEGGTLVDGVITFPVKGLLAAEPEYSSSWYYANASGAEKIVLPAYRSSASAQKNKVKANGSKRVHLQTAKKAFDKASMSVKVNSRSNIKTGVKARRTPVKAISLIK